MQSFLVQYIRKIQLSLKLGQQMEARNVMVLPLRSSQTDRYVLWLAIRS
uniref:Uncharacterized protein n=1 Tax=Siphoviridae sp. ct8rU2 TaxID=2825366 RepID=A0A8S5UWC5_9CAUD|nr:MAG TPA: hypothetical protein [Siphoviridae sp. ct8rU2]